MELDILRFIQSTNSSFLDHFFQGVTFFGEEMIYILIFAIAYWCFDKHNATKIILVFLLSAVVNSGLKGLFMRERPIGIDGIRTLREHTATGSSFPSGHTQGAATFFYYLAHEFQKTWVTVVCAIMIFLVGLSRLYLGVHWMTDVIAAIVIAITVVHFGIWLFDEFNTKRLLIILIIVNTLLFAFWNENYVVSTGIITGAIIGLIIENKYVNFETKTKSVLNQVIKVIFGLVVVLFIKEGVKIISPDTLLFDYLRYSLMGLWVSSGAPWIFKKFKLSA